MAPLPSGLETTSYGAAGWNDINTTNMQLLDSKLVNVMTANQVLGVPTVSSVALSKGSAVSQTSATVSMATVSGTGDDTNINNNFTAIQVELNALVGEMTLIIASAAANGNLADEAKQRLNELLVALRKTTGVGVLGG